MSTQQEQDCAVIGAGFLGLCTALQLLKRGFKVSLIDAQAPGLGASFGNAGFLATESIDPLATWATLKDAPGYLFDPHGPLKIPRGSRLAALPWIARFALAAWPNAVEKHRKALATLNGQAVGAWEDCLAGIGRRDLMVKSGYLLAWENQAGIKAAQQSLEHLQGWGIDVELIGKNRVDELEPEFDGCFSHALHFASAHRVRDPKWLCDALFTHFQSQGGRFFLAKVEQLQILQGDPSLRIDGELQAFSKVVICAGAYSAELLASVGISVPLMAERGYHLQCPGLQGRVTRAVCPVERRVFISPLDSGLRVVGFSELGGTRVPAQPERYKTLKHHAASLLPGLAGEFENAEQWMGMRPTLPDSLPVIDTLPQCSNVAAAFGNQHLGLTQAAISAELVVARLLGEGTSTNLDPYGINRF